MENFVISWNSYTQVFHQTLAQLLTSEEFTDCTLVCDGGQLKCHKFVLSACSPWFREVLLGIDHPCPVIILQDVNFQELKALLEFVYTGNVTVCEEELHRMVEVGKGLKVTGLVDEEKHISESAAKVPTNRNTTRVKPVIEAGKKQDRVDLDQSSKFSPTGENSRQHSPTDPDLNSSPQGDEDHQFQMESYEGHCMDEYDDEEEERRDALVRSELKARGDTRGRRSLLESRPDDLKDIIKYIRNGISCNWLSKKYGISVATIRKYAIAHGAPKGRNGRQKLVDKHLTDQDREAILSAVKRGVRYVQLAEMYGVSTTAISNFCKHHGCVSKRGRTRLFPSEPCITAELEQPDTENIQPLDHSIVDEIITGIKVEEHVEGMQE